MVALSLGEQADGQDQLWVRQKKGGVGTGGWIGLGVRLCALYYDSRRGGMTAVSLTTRVFACPLWTQENVVPSL